jgi:hypothetical protein
MRIQPRFMDSFSKIDEDGKTRSDYGLWNISPLFLIEMEDTDGGYSWNVYDNYDEVMAIWQRLKYLGEM